MRRRQSVKARVVRTSTLLALLVALVSFLLVGPAANAQFEQDPGSGGSGGGSGCSYCSSSTCGCSSAPVGYYLIYSCSCSSLTCTHSCSYKKL